MSENEKEDLQKELSFLREKLQATESELTQTKHRLEIYKDAVASAQNELGLVNKLNLILDPVSEPRITGTGQG